ncbi:MAG TPA: hypothetical protein VEY31_01745, partial [Roseococcus sp.]|nr:hypothetical protein [Roseococcus sp.]
MSVRSRRASAFHITGWLTRTPCSANTQARNSARVASDPAVTRARSASASGASRGGTWLRCGPGVASP